MHTFATKEVALKDVYGYDHFRGVQAEAIDAVVRDQRDVFLLMATGGGKSLCYQLPALVLGRAVVVVSPLISLIQDQVHALHQRDLSAVYLGSAQEDGSVWDRLETFQFLYVTPELASTDRFREALSTTIRPCLLAIDESHCVSEFGHDFRPEYRHLHELRDVLPEGTPLMAVTATARPQTRVDIVSNLRIRANALQLITTVDRPNLTYVVTPDKEYATLVAELRRTAHQGSAIVYTPTTRETEDLAPRLQRDLGVPCASYHGKLAPDVRKAVHERFLRDEVGVVVATSAFGMGVDKADIRLVVHWGACKTVESYYQAMGRAGRDGDPARCVMFVTAQDWVKLDRVLMQDTTAEGARRAKAGLQDMRTFCSNPTHVCRRLALVRYFGEPEGATPDACGECDACTLPPRPTRDLTREARAVLACTAALQAHYGAATVLGVARGAPPSQHAERLGALECCGGARDVPPATLRAVLDACRSQGLVVDRAKTTSSGHAYAAPELTDAGRAWLGAETSSLHARVDEAPSPSRKRGSASDGGGGGGGTGGSSGASSSSNVEAARFATLREVRRRLASRSTPAFMICTDATLRDMAARNPTTPQAMLDVSGMGKAKVAKYGQAFLEALRA